MRFEQLSPHDLPRVDALAAIENAIWDWCPSPREHFVHMHESWPEDKLIETHVLMDGETMLAKINLMETHWLGSPGQAQFSAGSLNKDDSAFKAIAEYGLNRLRGLGYSRFITSIPSKEAGYGRALGALGLELTMRNKVSCVGLDPFDFASEPIQGVELVSFPEAESRSPVTFKRTLWEAFEELLPDVPMAEPYQGEAYEDFVTGFFRQGKDFRACMFAFADGKVVGMAELNPNEVEPSLALTGLTGVSRDYRRRGIARQLKIASLLRAKEMGVRKVFTDNEEKNPMFLLNEELGFRHVWDLCLYSLYE